MRRWFERVRRFLLLAATDALYGRLALLYRPASWIVSRGRWETWQCSVVPAVASGRTVDVGCGPGSLLSKLRERGFAVGVDCSWSMAKRARQRGLVACAAAQKLPFRDRSFQTATATFPAPFIRERSVAVELLRVLEPGGCCVVLPGVDASLIGTNPGGSSASPGLERLAASIAKSLRSAGFDVAMVRRVLPGAVAVVVEGRRPPVRPA